MKERMQGIGEKLKTFFTGINRKTRIFLGVALGVVILVAVAAAIVLNNKPYEVLFTGLTGDEARTIMTYLDDNGLSQYRLEGGDTILVPKNQEPQLKAKLLMAGYPKSGFSYETYRSAVGTMSTEADRNIAYLQDLQDRMAGVIRCLDGVKDAVVTIVQGDDRRYVLNSDNLVEASASVMVTMQDGGKLTAQQASAIRNLVARAVKGLEIDNVAISDSMGNSYSSDDSVSGAGDASALMLSLEEQVNNSVRTQIMAVLSPLFGADNVRVGVNSTVDVSKSVGESTTYTEPSWAADGSTKGEGIIGSKVYTNEVIKGADNITGGVAGTQSNSDISTYVQNNTQQMDGNETYIKDDGQVNYNVDTNKEQVERVAGTVTDLMVSVSINSDVASGSTAADLLSHVARAAGIASDMQADKISILIAPFYQAPTPSILPDTSGLPSWALYAAIGGGVLLLLLLLLIFLLRRGARKRKAKQMEALLSSEGAVYSPGLEEQPIIAGANIMNIRTEKSMELRKDIRQFADENPEIAAQMVKGWLKGGEERDV